jgi:hypothetical protein
MLCGKVIFWYHKAALPPCLLATLPPCRLAALTALTTLPPVTAVTAPPFHNANTACSLALRTLIE